ncbi:hypothetical protein PG988_010977 [Apiospora saccharicola]
MSPYLHYAKYVRSSSFDVLSSNVSAWLDESTGSLAPVRCHSHNDYLRPHPLFSALAAGCIGVEADVFLSDDGQDLLIGHDRASLSNDKTLRSMYLSPLLEMLRHRNPGGVQQSHNSSINQAGQGIYRMSPQTSLVLLIDVKEKPDVVWPMVIRQLEQLRDGRFLTRYETLAETGSTLLSGALTVVGSGDLDLDTLIAAYGARPLNANRSFYGAHDTFLDAPLTSLEAGGPGNYGTSNSYYASTSFQASVGSARFGLSNEQRRKVRAQVHTARQKGLMARYWGYPAGRSATTTTSGAPCGKKAWSC